MDGQHRKYPAVTAGVGVEVQLAKNVAGLPDGTAVATRSRTALLQFCRSTIATDRRTAFSPRGARAYDPGIPTIPATPSGSETRCTS
jgi:hypothetical protein